MFSTVSSNHTMSNLNKPFWAQETFECEVKRFEEPSWMSPTGRESCTGWGGHSSNSRTRTFFLYWSSKNHLRDSRPILNLFKKTSTPFIFFFFHLSIQLNFLSQPHYIIACLIIISRRSSELFEVEQLWKPSTKHNSYRRFSLQVFAWMPFLTNSPWSQ